MLSNEAPWLFTMYCATYTGRAISINDNQRSESEMAAMVAIGPLVAVLVQADVAIPAARAAASRLIPSSALAIASIRRDARPSRSRRACSRSSAGDTSFLIHSAGMVLSPNNHAQ